MDIHKTVKIAVEHLITDDAIAPSGDVVESVEKDSNGNYRIRFTNGRTTTVRPGTVFLVG